MKPIETRILFQKLKIGFFRHESISFLLNSECSYLYLQLFHTDDFELQYLQKGHCPFCRNSQEE